VAGTDGKGGRLSPSDTPMHEHQRPPVLRFGSFELDLQAEQLRKNGRLVRLQHQPFKLLRLLTSEPGTLVTREAIKTALWTDDTFVDFEQGVNFAIKQVRDALGDRAENSIFIETVPKRGYRFIAPVNIPGRDGVTEFRDTIDPHLQRALWENIVELRLSDDRRRKQIRVLTVALVCMAIAWMVLFLSRP
jgi:DNA-binding winged helix-turn-helix (wHTH) protein